MSAPALLQPRARRLGRVAAVLAGGAMLLTACGSDAETTSEPAPGGSGEAAAEELGDVTVGAFNFGESQVMANMYALLLEDAGFTAEVRALGNREVVQPALQQGDLDVVPEYLGTVTEFLNKAANGEDAEAVASGDVDATTEALSPLAEEAGLVALPPSDAQDQNAFAVQESFATENDLTTLSDLAGVKDGGYVLGGPPECPDRPFCQPGLEETYGLEIAEFRSLDPGGPLTKQALSDGDIDLGLVFSSDGSLETFGLVVLEDDMGLQTADNLVPLVNAEAPADAISDALAPLSGEGLTTEQLQGLNKRVDVDGEDPAAVAEDFLTEQGLIGSE